MIRWFLVPIILLFAVSVQAEIYTGRVVGVTDGDTLRVLTERKQLIKIRLTNIDAPERKQPFGERAKQALSDLCFNAQAVVNSPGTDRYKRVLGQVTCNGVDANTQMVAQGMAWVYTKYNTNPTLVRHQQQAKKAKRGLWIDPNPVAPWELRKR